MRTRRSTAAFMVASLAVAIAVAATVAGTGAGAGAGAGASASAGAEPPGQKEVDAEGGVFRCEKNSAGEPIPQSFFNDDYCDCADGSDEPGTSACSHVDGAPGFFCRNVGHTPRTLPASRVDDGVCDCCDGSDERTAGLCANTCAEAQQQHRARQAGKVKIYAAGLEERARRVAEAQRRAAERATTLENAEVELASLRIRVAKAEEELASAQKLQSDQQKDINARLGGAYAAELDLASLPGELLAATVARVALQLRELGAETVIQHMRASDSALDAGTTPAAPTNMDEVALLHYSLNADGTCDRVDDCVENFISLAALKQVPKTALISTANILADEHDAHVHLASSVLKIVEGTEHARDVARLMQAAAKMRDRDNLVLDEVSTAEANLAKATSARKAMDDKIAEAKAGSGKSYGPDNAFESVSKSCFETTLGKYVYKVCPYGKAWQDTTELGTFKEEGQEENTWVYDGGRYCSGARSSRSALIRLSCGDREKITAVREPSICAYEIDFMSPSACSAEHRQLVESFS